MKELNLQNQCNLSNSDNRPKWYYLYKGFIYRNGVTHINDCINNKAFILSLV